MKIENKTKTENKTKIQNENESDNKYNIKFEDSLDAASASDCTGLIPSGYATEETLEEYRDIYEFGLPPHNEYHKKKQFRKNQE